MFRKNVASALVIAIALSTVLLVNGCGKKENEDQKKETEKNTPEVKTPVVKPEETPEVKSVVAPASAPAIGKKLLISTSMGDITIGLYEEKSPITAKNFMAYVDSGFYKNTIFHRVIKDFMIQGGGFTTEMARKRPLFRPIVNETYNHIRNTRGSVAMARTDKLNSATSEFFINHRNNKFLDHDGPNGGYAVFGRVLSGMNVVDKIAGVKTAVKNRMKDVPVEQVVINSITVIKE